MFEQDFRINLETKFDDLKITACEFWGERNEEEFKFYDEKLNDIFMDNDFNNRNLDDITVNKYFEILQFTNALLILK